MPTATVAAPGAAAAKPAVHQPKQLPPPKSDFYQLADVLTAEEKATVKKVRWQRRSKKLRLGTKPPQRKPGVRDCPTSRSVE